MNENQTRPIDTATASGTKAASWGSAAALAGSTLTAYLLPKAGPELSTAAGALATGALMGLGAWVGSLARNIELKTLGRILPVLAMVFVALPADAQEPRADVYPAIIAATYNLAATATDLDGTVSLELVRVDVDPVVSFGCRELSTGEAVEDGVQVRWPAVELEATPAHAVVRAIAYPASECRGPASDLSANAARIFFRAPNAPLITDASGGV